MTLENKYLFEAIDNYPYNLEEAIEALNYALSYDDENPIALCLKGQVMAEQLSDFNGAIEYYELALQADLYCLKVYPLYIGVLILNDDFDKAQKTIDFALTIKGMDRGGIWLRQANLFEHLKKYKKALKAIKKAKVESYNDEFSTWADGIKNRVKSKLKKK